jgi:hypothetical protein
MTDYHMHGINLSKNQAQKIITASKKDRSVKIRLSKDNLHGDYKLPLTQTQIKRINKTKTGLDLELSASQLKHMEKSGGFLPLLTLLPLILGGLGAAGAVTGGIAGAVSSAKNNRETERHNREVETQLRNGSGVVSNFVSKVPLIGSFLGPILERFGLGVKDQTKLMKGDCVSLNKLGKGLYLKPYGNGLYLGPKGDGLFLDHPR